MTALPPEKSTRRQKLIWGGLIVAGVLILIVTFSRKDSGPTARESADGNRREAAGAQLRGQLLATLDGLRPERLHVSSNEQNIVGDLNLWWADFSKTVDGANSGNPAELVGKWLGDDAAANAAAERFSARDAAHVRNALMYRAIAASLVANQTSDRDRAIAAFNLVVRHISPMKAFVEPAPLGAFEVLLSGRGATEDRIWVFAEIMRQLGIDCVVIEPQTPVADVPAAARLVGAIVEGAGVLLFDPQLGLPIPQLDDRSGPMPSSVASYSEALQNDALFRQFDATDGTTYPWTSDALKDVAVRFIVDSTYAAPRMLAVQTALPEEYVATLFDGPPPSAGSPSLEARVITAGADGLWSADSVAAWSYPERQMQAFFAAGGETSADARTRLATLQGPKVLELQDVERNGTMIKDYVPVDSRRPLRVVRVEHLRGNVLPALEGYVQIRSAPAAAGNAEVHEDAVHWIAVCQEELEEFELAYNTLNRLLRDYPTGLWHATSQRALPRCEAKRGNFQHAIELMPVAADGQPANLADAWFVRRWKSQAATSSSTADLPAE